MPFKPRPVGADPEPPPPPPTRSLGLRALHDITHEGRDWPAVAASAIALRMAGRTYQQIADELYVSAATVSKWMMEARKNAQLFDIGHLLDQVALPQAVDNLITGLEAGNEKYTLATLKGRGAFESRSVQETHSTSMALEIHVEMPTSARAASDVVQGQIVGQARVVKDGDG